MFLFLYVYNFLMKILFKMFLNLELFFICFKIWVLFVKEYQGIFYMDRIYCFGDVGKVVYMF